MFDQAFRNIDDVLWKEAGCTTELDYTEQTSWLLFLKYLDGPEQDRAAEAELDGRTDRYLLEGPYRWESWAAPKLPNGKIDHNRAATGDDLREVIDHVDALRFRSQAEQRELSYLYEAKIRNMGNAGGNGGEYYTPRPLIRAIVRVVRPEVDERVHDGAAGSADLLRAGLLPPRANADATHVAVAALGGADYAPSCGSLRAAAHRARPTCARHRAAVAVHAPRTLRPHGLRSDR